MSYSLPQFGVSFGDVDTSYTAADVTAAVGVIGQYYNLIRTYDDFHTTAKYQALMTACEANSIDVILCNPPFHQQTATTDHIAWQMFKDSHRVLKKGGELRIIGNRQLGYHIKLKRIFGNEKLIASNDKFVTISAIKR